jgi:copper homeostasis protein
MPLEIALDSVHDAAAAVPFADRVELCRDLSRHGLTPASTLVRAVWREIDNAPRRPQLVVLIRPTVLNTMTDAEIATCEREIATAVDAGADGFALGVLDETGGIARAPCERLLRACAGKPATFHRAFDFAADRMAALETLIALGFARVLTAGVGSFDHSTIPLAERQAAISETARQADGRIAVIACAGVRARNASAFLTLTPEVHSSCRVGGVFDAREAAALHAIVAVRA